MPNHNVPQEPFRLIAECVAVADADASLDVRISFLQLMQQQQGGSSLLTDPSLAWDEAIERTSEHACKIEDLIASPLSLTVQIETAGASTALNPDLRIELSIGAQLLQDGACKLRLEVQNTTHLAASAAAKRDEALPLSLVSAHLLLGLSSGEFVSLLDPGPAYHEAVAACSNTGVFPVLVGEEPAKTMMLCSPIILYDYPRIAPESEGDFFDGTEMDEMLTLRVLTLTDEEKQEMRGGDPRARRILERTESLTSDAMLKTHGVIRGLRDMRGDAS